MKRKYKIWIYILEIIIILAVVAYLAITKVFPEYQKALGSSERLFSTNNYETAIEIDITTGPAFFLIINKHDEVSNIFIENEKAGVIANKNIEGKKIAEAIPEIIQKLLDAGLTDNQVMNIINYKVPRTYQKVVNLIKKTLEKNEKNVQIVESTSTLQKKAKLLKIESTSDNQILWSLYLNSTDIIDRLPKSTTSQKININKESASVYADTIYQKILTYMMNANVQEQEIYNTTMPIQYIPGNDENTIYASSSSWYYIKNYKVYAQITIPAEKENYTFCYFGSSDDKKEGICS